jgi:hypothetical protein
MLLLKRKEKNNKTKFKTHQNSYYTINYIIKKI